jgi:hypothetical protein
MTTETMRLYSPGPVTVPAAGFTTIATIQNIDKKLLCFQFDVSTQALDQFKVSARAHGSRKLKDFSLANWAVPEVDGRIIETDSNLAAVAAGGDGYFAMDISGIVEIVIEASAAVDSAIVTPGYSLH